MQQFKDMLDQMVQAKVIECCGALEWGLPAFVVPKPDGTVRWIADLRELNKVVKR